MFLCIAILVSSTIYLVYPLFKSKFDRGIDDIENRNYRSAVETFSDIIREDPKDAQAHNNLGVAYFYLGQFEKAITSYTNAISLDPEYDDAFNNRGLAKAEIVNYNGAIEDFNEALSLSPNDASYYNNRGSSYKLIENYSMAINDFLKAHQLDPKIPRVVGNLISTYKMMGNCEEVIYWSTFYIENYPPRKNAFIYRGQCKEINGDSIGAHKDYTAAGDIDRNRDKENKSFSFPSFREIWPYLFGFVTLLALAGLITIIKHYRNI